MRFAGRILRGAPALTMLAGCTLLADLDKTQCQHDADCAAPLICGPEGVCADQTGCKTDRECRQPGICVEGMCAPPECNKSASCPGQSLCDTAQHRCVSNQITCEANADCANYEGAEYCRRSSGLCGTAECAGDAECLQRSPTASCQEGSCEDETWGCLGVKDPRPAANMSREGVFKAKVLYAYAQNGAKETGVRDLQVKVCHFNDPQCEFPLPPENWSYGEDNYLVVRGLDSTFGAHLNYLIQLQAKHPTRPEVDLMPGEFAMFRTVAGDTVEPKPILMFEAAARDAIASLAQVNVDPSLGLLYTRIFDCTDTEVAGVSIDVDVKTVGCAGDCETTVFYMNTVNQPTQGATETNSAGRGGIVNLKPDVFNRLTLTRTADHEEIAHFIITPRPNTVTYVHFYPWDYGTSTK